MTNPLFKKGKGQWERAFVLPAAPLGHFAFAIMIAVIFVNLRMMMMRQGISGIMFDALLGGASFILTAILLNLLPAKFIRDES